MSDSALEVGEKIHIITRRRFEGDLRRHFVGEVVGISGDLHRVRGYAFVFNPGTNQYNKRPDVRTRVLALGQDGYVVNIIPRGVEIASLEYRVKENRLAVTDNKHFTMDINEFGISA